MLQQLWILTSYLLSSARDTAVTVVSFMEKPRSKGAICTAATIIVDQVQHDLCEMGMVRNPYWFKGTSSVCIRDTLMTEEYVSRCPEELPLAISTRAFPSTALNLFPALELHAKITHSLLDQVRLVP